MSWLATAGIALANNLDNASVGLALALARVRIGPLVNLWIAFVTFVITAASVLAGNRVARIMPAGLAHGMCASILGLMGLWMVATALLARRDVESANSAAAGPLSMRALLADPRTADADRSYNIDLREGTLLALTLCINNVGGGVGAGLARLSAVGVGLLSAAVSFAALGVTGWAGQRVRLPFAGRQTQLVAGIMLLLVAWYELP